MATGRNYLNKPTTTYRFINTVERDTKNPFTDQPPMFEFDETHLWNSSNNMMMIPSSSPKKSSSIIPNSRITTKKSSKNNGDHRTGGTAKSLPMNIPDWSKILRDDRYRVNRKSEFDDYVDEEDDVDDIEDERIPPHEFLARQLEKTQIASFSVHEGIGRTLKGRDLSRVRDAIWQKTGFED